jgi:selenocysteine-specific elongation factor
LEDLLQSATLIRAGSEIFHQETWKILQDRALELIGVTHIREPEMPGLELQRLRRQLSPTMSQEAFALLIDQIASTNGLLRRGAFVALPSHRIELEQRDQALWQSIKPLLAHTAFQPPRVRDIAKELNIAENEIRENLRKVARVGDVVLVALDHFFLKTAVSEMAKIVEQIGDGNPHVRAGAFRDQIGGGRKVAIQILEFFDRVGFTRRIKDNHLVRRSNPWSDI